MCAQKHGESLHAYIDEAFALRKELIRSLSTPDIDSLRTDILILGSRGWKAWWDKNIPEVSAFLQSPPAKRRATARWQDQTTHGRLTLGSIRLLNYSVCMMGPIEAYVLYPGWSYREMAVRSGKACLEVLIHYLKVKEWPFDDPDPFVDS